MGDNLTDLRAIVDDEINSAKRQHEWNNLLHIISIAVVIISGGLTTYFAATKLDSQYITAGLAFLTTIAGTFEKTFSFGKNAAGYRDAKTRFQNLRLEFVRREGELTEPERDALIDELRSIRLLKAELTSSN
ncbi:hypothetical protein [Ruegeria hyattellae]|uniref:hypothetical protein n=1 Tax=Ruegeria hyattellae TaxID=3233337 RepID=UPI00355B0733